MSGVPVSVSLFLLFLATTLGITWWANRRTATAADWFTADRRLRGWQNGVAISGGHLAAASFVGVPGLVALAGMDGMLYAVGFEVGLVLVMVVVAEAVSGTGRYTLGDTLAMRLRQAPVRLAVAASTLTICLLYLVASMVAAGSVAGPLFAGQRVLGLAPDVAAIALVGVVMVVYTAAGGMLGVTWVQVVKAGLLLAGSVLLALLTLSRFGFSMPALLEAAAEGSGRGDLFLTPGLGFGHRLDLLSLGLALAVGTAGLPHVMVRLLTVSGAGRVRSSLRWAIGMTVAFAAAATVIGLGAAALVGSGTVAAADRAGNLAGPLLARALGGGADTFGGDLLLALMAAIAVAAILGTLAGLTIAAASSLARDLYATITGRRGGALVEHVEHREVLVARLAAPGIGLLAVALALGLRHSNAALLAGLAFAAAASANVPALVLALFWSRFNTTGAVAGILTGLGSCLLLVLAGPMVVGPDGFLLASIRPLFPLQNPAILSVPLGFAGAWLGTIVASRQLTALAAARKGELVAAGSFRSMRFSALTGLRLARPNGRGQG